jgi:hypothetical protein
MKTVEFIRMGLDMSAGIALQLIEDMEDQPLMFPTPKGGNHPLWVLGHLAWVEGELLQVMLGRANPVAHWKPVFGPGTEPTASAADYPSFDEARKAFQDLRAQTMNVLATLTDADLDRSSERCPPEVKHLIGTYAQCFLIMIVNTMTHHGQVADARRAAGRKRLHL